MPAKLKKRFSRNPFSGFYLYICFENIFPIEAIFFLIAKNILLDHTARNYLLRDAREHDANIRVYDVV